MNWISPVAPDVLLTIRWSSVPAVSNHITSISQSGSMPKYAQISSTFSVKACLFSLINCSKIMVRKFGIVLALSVIHYQPVVFNIQDPSSGINPPERTNPVPAGWD
ncbi:hypothetical protein [Proteiniphilum sp.]|uniref:hypothetical protein n=1 Tax=Proteiniphilum sp. TaxID=1926877 RepID=UPI0033257CF3